jgi:hypothetical protein
MNNPNPVSNSLPDGYQEILYWRITEKKSRILFMNILAIPLFIIFGLFFSALADRLGRLPSSIEFGLREVGMILLGVILTLVLHELVHGMAMQMYGANPKYGVIWKQMMLYATSPGFAYRRNNYVVVALAPLVLISILIVLGLWVLQGTLWVALLAVCGTINASGAVGDMWITTIALRFAPTAHIMDERDGIRVFLPKP